MSASAGRVLLLFKGTYDTTVTYFPLDVVKYGVSSYVCKAESTGNMPTNTSYWQTLAEGIANITPEELGFGYGLSSDTGVARTATLSGYELIQNGIVAVTFAVDVPANATLNINNEGAKAIYYRGSTLVANVIRGGDTVTFTYDGTRYNVLCIDGGAGHEIENSAGTKLLQRDILKFTGGLKATDDSTNEKTVIDDTPDYMDWDDWSVMTEEAKNAYIASHDTFAFTDLPDTQGVINAEYMTLLWENPNTTQAFVAQDITLSSADYDFLMIFASYSTANPRIIPSSVVPKGGRVYLSFSYYSNSIIDFKRAIDANDTTLSIGGCDVNGSANNAFLIPIAVYGIKKDFQFKVNAIATELSTSADHCFLSDDVTDVESAIEDCYVIKETSRPNVTTNANGAAQNLIFPFDYKVLTVWCNRNDCYARLLYSANGLLPQFLHYNNTYLDNDTITVYWRYAEKYTP